VYVRIITQVSQRRTNLKILPLCFRRKINDLLFFLKIIHGFINVDFSSEIVFSNSSRDLRSTNDKLLSAQSVRMECFKSSYFNPIVRLWNMQQLALQLRYRPLSLSES
jgi:hypothetical protein